jgi:stage V sporulation protein G
MQITEIAISLRDEEKLKAFVNVTFDNCFVVRGMKVIKGTSGYFISMPSRKATDGSFRDVAHPISNEFRQELETAILKKYEEAIAEREKQGPEAEVAETEAEED